MTSVQLGMCFTAQDQTEDKKPESSEGSCSRVLATICRVVILMSVVHSFSHRIYRTLNNKYDYLEVYFNFSDDNSVSKTGRTQLQLQNGLSGVDVNTLNLKLTVNTHNLITVSTQFLFIYRVEPKQH